MQTRTRTGRSQDDEKLTFLSVTLGNHMVLQRAPQSAVLFGFTAPGATVTTSMTPSGGRAGAADARTFQTVAGADGTWRQALPPMPASTTDAYDFAIASSNSTAERATMQDVLFGDVYMCGGQVLTKMRVPSLPYSQRCACRRFISKDARCRFLPRFAVRTLPSGITFARCAGALPIACTEMPLTSPTASLHAMQRTQCCDAPYCAAPNAYPNPRVLW